MLGLAGLEKTKAKQKSMYDDSGSDDDGPAVGGGGDEDEEEDKDGSKAVMRAMQRDMKKQMKAAIRRGTVQNFSNTGKPEYKGSWVAEVRARAGLPLRRQAI